MKTLKIIGKGFIRMLSKIVKKLYALECELSRHDKYLAEARDKVRLQYLNFGHGEFL